jgi:hypothetical protein
LSRLNDRLRSFWHGISLHGIYQRYVPLESFFLQDGLDLRSEDERQPYRSRMNGKRDTPT